MKRLALVVLIALVSSANAQQILPEELALTRSIVMQDADELEFSMPVRFSKSPDQKRLTPSAEFEYGLNETWEVDAEVPYVFLYPSVGGARDGIGDVEAALRYGLFRDHLSLGLGITAPTGSHRKDLGEGQVSIEPFFTASRWFGKLNAQFNGGWQRTLTSGGEVPRDDFEYNIAILYPVRAWYLALEGNGETNRKRTKYYITPELIWKPRREVELLLATSVGVTRAAGDYGIVASITFEFDNATGHATDKD
jgi:hypothetical protein